MTSDMIQNEYTEKSAKTAKSASPFSSHVSTGAYSNRLELTRDPLFVDGAQDIFDILARQSGEKSTASQNRLEQNLGETVNFFEKTRTMLRRAEEKISEQTHRIRTLEDLSGVDPLTGLLNAKGFSKILVREVSRTIRGYNEGGLLVIFSLENHASILNDHGQKPYERAVKLIGRALENEIRDMDVAARISDDEFVLLFTDTCMSKALSRLQNMALRLNRLSLIWDGQEIRISLSLGLKSYEEGSDAEDIFKAASHDLKRNKQSANTL